MVFVEKDSVLSKNGDCARLHKAMRASEQDPWIERYAMELIAVHEWFGFARRAELHQAIALYMIAPLFLVAAIFNAVQCYEQWRRPSPNQ